MPHSSGIVLRDGLMVGRLCPYGWVDRWTGGQEDTMGESTSAHRVFSENPVLTVEHVTRVFGTRALRTTVLEDVTFQVPAQSLLAITGPSGSGKSTLLNLLSGIDRPTSGRILFEGSALNAKSENQLARWRGRHVGIIFQFFQLVPTLTALENVLLALELGGGGGLPRSNWREHALTCLALVGMEGLAHRLPSALSGGQQQRAAIARALANNPPVLIADEPTGNLDSQTAHAVFDTLANLTRIGKTVVYVTHDRVLAQTADTRIKLLDGRVVDVGATPAITHSVAEVQQ